VDAYIRRPVALGLVSAVAVLNVGLGAMLATARLEGTTLAVIPLFVLALAVLIASDRAVLVFAAIGLCLLRPLPFAQPLPLPTTVEVYLPDILVVLAVVSWLGARLIDKQTAGLSHLRTRVLGWPLLLFGLLLFIAVLHGHARYGTNIVSVPLRFFLYAGIAFALTDLEPRKAYRWLVIVFYGGTIWQVLVGIHDLATGTAATGAVLLSTGGERVLAGSTAMFMAGTLLLALLNLEVDRGAGRMALHLVMAALAIFALVLTFQRTTFTLIPLLVPVLFLAFRHVRSRTLSFLPLCAPFVALAVLLLPRADPQLYPTLADRLTASPTSDTAVTWRVKATDAVFRQIDEAPVTGVGFGRNVSFEIEGQRLTMAADPHNQFLYLWAGGGLLLLGSFVLLLVVYLFESWRRFKSGSTDERPIVFWAVSIWFLFVVNSTTGIVLTTPALLLVFWILMLLPMVVRPWESGDVRSA
jgi:O-antigen ligase